MADASCKSCIADAYITIEHDDEPGTEYEVPAVQRITKTYQETQANRTRHSHSGTQFVSPCGSDTRTPLYTVQALYCNDDPLDWYLQDGDIVTVKVYKGRAGGTDLNTFVEEFEATFVSGGWDWDNTTEDGEEITFTFEPTSPVTRTFPAGTDVPYPTGSPPYVGTP